MTMKIVHCVGGSKIQIKQVDRPKPQPGEVLIKTAVSALCGSEMKTYRTDAMAYGNNGHEAAGVVAELGDGVSGLALGDRVGCSAIAGCGECAACRRGQYTWCPQFRFFGHMHAEYFVVPALACHRLPDDVPWDVGVLITGDGLGVPYHSSTKLPANLDRQFVAVFGLGPIGLGQVLMQSWLGRRVIGIDRSPQRLALATRLGAESTIAVQPQTDVVQQVRQLTGSGAAVCIEAAGIPLTAQQCFKAVRTAGMVVFNGEQPKVELSPSDDFIRRDITAVGAWFYHFSEYPAMLELYRQGMAIDRLVTHRYPIDQADQAYRVMADGESAKVLLTY